MAQERKKKPQAPQTEQEMSLKEREYRDEKGEIHHHTKKKQQQMKSKGSE